MRFEGFGTQGDLMERFWLKGYPAGVPADVDVTQYRSLPALLEDAFRRHADRNAFIFMDHPLTYAELDRLSAAFGAWLQGTGLPRGARVAIMMPNILQYPVALAGALRAGYVVVNVNPLYTPRELEHQMKDSGAEAIVLLENFATTLEQVVARTSIRHVIVTALGDLLGFPKSAVVNFAVRRVKHMVPPFELPGHVKFNDVLEQGRGLRLEPVALGPEDIAFLQYTGGTTGVAKGAVLLHRNMVANLLQCDAWFQPALQDTSRGPVPEQFVFVCALPLYHAFALVANGLLGIRLGAVNVLVPNPRDIHQLVKDVRHHPFNVLPAVNTLLNALAEDPGFRKLDFSSETSPAATANPILSREWYGTIGLPMPGTEIAILDDAGRPLPLGEPGEIAIRGPQVMAGYWQRPDETEKVMTPDGFFRSGDIGTMDERGHTRIVDRKKDMIIVSGFNVYPNEIESVVTQHPSVLECAAVGVPDERTGEAVKLFVVRKDRTLTDAALMEHCRQQFTGYKRPKFIEFRDQLPKSNVGKILRRELRDAQPAEVARTA